DEDAALRSHLTREGRKVPADWSVGDEAEMRTMKHAAFDPSQPLQQTETGAGDISMLRYAPWSTFGKDCFDEFKTHPGVGTKFSPRTVAAKSATWIGGLLKRADYASDYYAQRRHEADRLRQQQEHPEEFEPPQSLQDFHAAWHNVPADVKARF